MLFWISIYIIGVVVNAAALTAEAYMDGYKPIGLAAWGRVLLFVAGSWASWVLALAFFLWCVFEDIHNGKHFG